VHYKCSKGHWYAHFVHRGDRDSLPEPTVPLSLDFMEEYTKRLKRVQDGQSPVVEPETATVLNFKGTLAWCIEEYKTATRNVGKIRAFQNLAPKTQENYTQALDFLKAEMGDSRMSSIESGDIVDMQIELAEEQSTSFADLCVGTIRLLWNFHKITLRLGPNPANDIPKAHEGQNIDPWPDPVIAKAWKAADARERLILAIYLFTCQRGSDVVGMKWEHYFGNCIHVYKQKKTGTPVVIPIFGPLKKLLDKMERDGEFIVLNAWGRQYADRSTLSKALKALLIRIGHPEYKPHGLRANGACILYDNGCDKNEIMAFTGHKTLASLERYLKKAIQKRDAMGAAKKMEGKELAFELAA